MVLNFVLSKYVIAPENKSFQILRKVDNRLQFWYPYFYQEVVLKYWLELSEFDSDFLSLDITHTAYSHYPILEKNKGREKEHALKKINRIIRVRFVKEPSSSVAKFLFFFELSYWMSWLMSLNLIRQKLPKEQIILSVFLWICNVLISS